MEEHVEIYDYSDILHMHCRSCYKSGCTEQENCLMIRCLYCSVFLHSCKIDDHETICLMVQVSCPNVLNGCSSKMQKNEMAKHLETCPANVIHCGMEWNRYPLYSRVRLTRILTHCPLMAFGTHVQITLEENVAWGHIDTGNILVLINLQWMISGQICKS